MHPPVNLLAASDISSPSLPLLSPNRLDRCDTSSNGPVHPPVGEKPLAIDIPCSIGGEKDTSLTDFFEGRWIVEKVQIRERAKF
jgi:hypothetical protein